jgi:hypothetical protein
MDVIGYPKYIIYEDGRIIDKETKKDLNNYDDKNGYKLVCLRKELGKWDMKKVHRLLAEHFIPNPHHHPQVDHFNRITNDNRLSNLRWVNLSTQNINRKSNNNHRNIHFIKTQNIGTSYRFTLKRNKKVLINATFRSLYECVWFKFVYILLDRLKNKQ